MYFTLSVQDDLEITNMVRPLLMGQMGSVYLMQPRVAAAPLFNMPNHPAAIYHMQPRVPASNYLMQPHIPARNYEMQPDIRSENFEMQPDIDPSTFEDDLISDFGTPRNFNRPIEGAAPILQELRLVAEYLAPERIRFGQPTLFNIVPDDDDGTSTTMEPASTPVVDTTPIPSTTVASVVAKAIN